MWKIGNIEIKNQVVLAPMAGISNTSYRTIIKEMGAGLIYAEMVSDKAIMFDNDRTIELLKMRESERPIAQQIFGSDEDSFVIAAKKIVELMHPDILDINMGCPVPKIALKSQAGASLLKDPDKIEKIVRSVVNAVDIPVTVKIRSGWDSNTINCVEVAKRIENAGASAITLHARTRAQGYSGSADWSLIKKVKEAVKIPVIGNGDVHDGKSAKYMLDYTGCDGIMIGRAAQGNPWLFSSVLHYLKTGDELAPPTLEERSDIAEKHLRLLVKFKGEYRGVLEGRKHMAWYFKGLCGGAKLRNLINQCDTLEQMLDLISYENLRDF